MTKEDFEKLTFSKVNYCISILSVIGIIVSMFTGIWHFKYAWEICLTSLLTMCVSWFVMEVAKKVLNVK